MRTAEVRPGPRLELRATEPRQVEGPAVLELRRRDLLGAGGLGGATDAHGTLVLERA